MNRRNLAFGAVVLLAALAVRLWPLVVSPLPYNIDGFVLAQTTQEFLDTGSWTPDDHETTRPGAFLLLALASLLTRVDPLALAQPFFSAMGAASVLATAYLVRRAAGTEAALLSLPVAAFLGSYVYYSAAVMKQATGFVLLPLALALLLLRPTRSSTLVGGALLLALPLFHHFVAFIALTTLALAFVTQAAASGWRSVPRAHLALVGAGAAWSLLWVYLHRDPIGTSVSVAAQDAALYASLFALGAIGVHFAARRPLDARRASIALALPPLLGAAALTLNAVVPLFEGGYETPRWMLAALVPYALTLAIAGAGVGVALGVRDASVRALCLGLLGSIVLLLLFALLRGLDAASFYLAQRTVDFVMPVAALGYGVFAARLLRRRASGRVLQPVALAALLLLPALSLPIAFADTSGVGFGNQVTVDEYAALQWTAENVEGPVATDTRFGFILAQAMGRSATQTLAYDLHEGHPPPASTTLVVANSWATHGGEMKPLGRFRVDLDALFARCETLHQTPDARVLRCDGA